MAQSLKDSPPIVMRSLLYVDKRFEISNLDLIKDMVG